MKQMIYYKNQLKINIDRIWIDKIGNIEYDDEIYEINQKRKNNYPALMVKVISTGKNYNLRLHRAMAFTFNEWYIDQTDLDIHHIDENKENYSFDNLLILSKDEHRKLHNGK